jgi:hypothetical protein
MVRPALGGKRMDVSLTNPERKTLLQPLNKNRTTNNPEVTPWLEFIFIRLFINENSEVSRHCRTQSLLHEWSRFPFIEFFWCTLAANLV